MINIIKFVPVPQKYVKKETTGYSQIVIIVTTGYCPKSDKGNYWLLPQKVIKVTTGYSQNISRPFHLSLHLSYRVHCVAFDGQSRLASGSKDNTVRLWDIKSGQLIHTFRGHTVSFFHLISTLNSFSAFVAG